MPDDLAVPPGLVAALEAIAERDRRPVSEVLQDALEDYLAQHRDAASISKLTPAEAVDRMLASRTRLPGGVTIRDLMTEGRD